MMVQVQEAVAAILLEVAGLLSRANKLLDVYIAAETEQLERAREAGPVRPPGDQMRRR